VARAYTAKLSRWMRLQSRFDSRGRSSDDTSTATSSQNATTPKATGTVRQADAPGTNRSAQPNGTNESATRAPRCTPTATTVSAPR